MSTNGGDVPWWEDGAGFFGRGYMEGDDSLEGYLVARPGTLDERTGDEVDGVMRLLGLRAGDRLMDVPCGYGRHAIGFARRGLEVVGVDINGEELEVAAQRGAGLPNLSFLRRNMRSLGFQGAFDAVANLFFSFGFFERDEDNEACLRQFHEALRPGGRFVMHTDVHIPRIRGGRYRFHEERELRSGRVLVIDERLDEESFRLRGTWAFRDPSGAITRLPAYDQRVYTYDEFADACRRVGFSTVEGLGGWGGEPMSDDAEMMIVIARK